MEIMTWRNYGGPGVVRASEEFRDEPREQAARQPWARVPHYCWSWRSIDLGLLSPCVAVWLCESIIGLHFWLVTIPSTWISGKLRVGILTHISISCSCSSFFETWYEIIPLCSYVSPCFFWKKYYTIMKVKYIVTCKLYNYSIILI
jgi:hypothetical protein